MLRKRRLKISLLGELGLDPLTGQVYAKAGDPRYSRETGERIPASGQEGGGPTQIKYIPGVPGPGQNIGLPIPGRRPGQPALPPQRPILPLSVPGTTIPTILPPVRFPGKPPGPPRPPAQPTRVTPTHPLVGLSVRAVASRNKSQISAMLSRVAGEINRLRSSGTTGQPGVRNQIAQLEKVKSSLKAALSRDAAALKAKAAALAKALAVQQQRRDAARAAAAEKTPPGMLPIFPLIQTLPQGSEQRLLKMQSQIKRIKDDAAKEKNVPASLRTLIGRMPLAIDFSGESALIDAKANSSFPIRIRQAAARKLAEIRKARAERTRANEERARRMARDRLAAQRRKRHDATPVLSRPEPTGVIYDAPPKRVLSRLYVPRPSPRPPSPTPAPEPEFFYPTTTGIPTARLKHAMIESTQWLAKQKEALKKRERLVITRILKTPAGTPIGRDDAYAIQFYMDEHGRELSTAQKNFLGHLVREWRSREQQRERREEKPWVKKVRRALFSLFGDPRIRAEAGKVGVTISDQEMGAIRNQFTRYGEPGAKIAAAAIIGTKVVAKKITESRTALASKIAAAKQEAGAAVRNAAGVVADAGRHINDGFNRILNPLHGVEGRIVAEARKSAHEISRAAVTKMMKDPRDFGFNRNAAIPPGISADDLSPGAWQNLRNGIHYVNASKWSIIKHEVPRRAQGFYDWIGRGVVTHLFPGTFKDIVPRTKSAVSEAIAPLVESLVTRGTGAVFNPGNDAHDTLEAIKRYADQARAIAEKAGTVAGQQVAPEADRLRNKIRALKQDTGTEISRLEAEIGRLAEVAREVARGPDGDVDAGERLYAARRRLKQVQAKAATKMAALESQLGRIGRR